MMFLTKNQMSAERKEGQIDLDVSEMAGPDQAIRIR